MLDGKCTAHHARPALRSNLGSLISYTGRPLSSSRDARGLKRYAVEPAPKGPSAKGDWCGARWDTPTSHSTWGLLADEMGAPKVSDFRMLYGRKLEPNWLERYPRPAEGLASALPTLAEDVSSRALPHRRCINRPHPLPKESLVSPPFSAYALVSSRCSAQRHGTRRYLSVMY